MPDLFARHNAILNQSIEMYHGFVLRIVGDSFSAAFGTASDALYAALEAQRKLQNESWSPAPIKVRIGIHTGSAQLKDAPQGQGASYEGYATLALTQRVMSVGHGGQTLLSQTTHDPRQSNLYHCDNLANAMFGCARAVPTGDDMTIWVDMESVYCAWSLWLILFSGRRLNTDRDMICHGGCLMR